MTAISEVLHRGPPITQASKALILLHGRGGTAQNILYLANKLCDDQFYIAAPQATRNTWYPNSFMSEEKLNEPFLSSSIKSIEDLIDQTARHIPKNQIYLAGFSQGACLALEISSRSATKYGGIIAFTGGLMGSTVDVGKYHGNFEGTKVFISTGDQDPYIPLIRSQKSKELIEKLGAHVTLKVYKGRDHLVSEDEIKLAKSIIIL